MSKVATVFGVMGKSLGLLPDAVAARGSFNVIKNQNRFKIGAAGSQFQTASRRRANARSTSRTSGCCQTYGISMGWLLCGDLKALQRMMQAPLGKEAATPERERFVRLSDSEHRTRNRQRLAAHAAQLRRMFTLHRRSVAVEMWISGANLQHRARARGLRPRVSSRICVPHNQYVRVHVAAPARSRHVANALIAASVLSMIQPSRANHCAKISLRFE